MKRVIIVHGWGGYPEYGWFPWLKQQLEMKGLAVIIPSLPDTDHPKIEPWVSALTTAIGYPDQQTYLIGHSLGCQTIARYLESLPEGTSIGGAVFVAGFFKRLTNIQDDPSGTIVGPWLGSPIDLQKVKSHLPKSTAIFSDNDKWVPLDNQDDFRDGLDSNIIIEHAMGHFSGPDDGCVELPIALESILQLSA